MKDFLSVLTEIANELDDRGIFSIANKIDQLIKNAAKIPGSDVLDEMECKRCGNKSYDLDHLGLCPKCQDMGRRMLKEQYEKYLSPEEQDIVAKELAIQKSTENDKKKKLN